jgi:transposase InsO family protein
VAQPRRKTTQVDFLLDTGAELSVLTLRDFRRSVRHVATLQSTSVRLINFDSTSIKKPKGQVTCQIGLSESDQPITADFQVVSDSCQSVLGAPEMKRLGLTLNMAEGSIQRIIPDLNSQQGDIVNVRIGHSQEGISEVVLSKTTNSLAEVHSATARLQTQTDPIDRLVSKFPDLFTEGVGVYHGFQHSIRLKENSVPKRSRMREAPLAFADMAKSEIELMLRDGLVERISRSDWVSPVHYVKKEGKCVRVTVDYSTGLNQAIDPTLHPLPRPQDIFQKARNAKILSKLDISKGYWHIELHPDSRPLTAFITPSHGLLQFCRLPMGMVDSGAVFCRAVEETLQGLSGVESYVDDILIYGSSQADHDRNLDAALQALQAAGFRLNRKKILISKTSLPMLGSILSCGSSGLTISVDPKRTEALNKMKTPTTITHVRSFLGACERTHISSFSHIAEPLIRLTRKNVPFEWTDDCEAAFECLKTKMSHAIDLTPFDPSYPIVLRTDASDVGLGAYLLLIKDGEECPVSFAARTLIPAERNYSTPEKEALAAVWAIDKQFSKFLLGQHFVIESDQSSMTTLLPKHSARASQRIQRWTDRLRKYDFTARFVPGKENVIADFLSRIHFDDGLSTNSGCILDDDDSAAIICSLDGIPLADFVSATENDSDLKIVSKFISAGWPEKAQVPRHLWPFYEIRLSLTNDSGILLRGFNIVVPTELRSSVLDLLHTGHPGISRMQQQYRNFYYWPRGSSEVKQFCEECHPCRTSGSAKSTESVPVGSIPPPDKPWTELSLDITGPFANAPHSQRFIVVLQDYFSKFPVVLLTNSITSQTIIKWMKRIFSLFGSPLKIRSDNGRQFVSEEFQDFLKIRNIAHDRSAVYHPQANGLVEVFNRYLKHGIQKYAFTSGSFVEKVDELLAHFRATAPENSVSPSELLFGWRLRPTWSAYNRFLLPRGNADVDWSKTKSIQELKLDERRRIVQEKFARRRYGRDPKTPLRPYIVGSWVTVRNPSTPKGLPPRSRPLRVEKILGNWNYLLSDGQVHNARRMSRFFPTEYGSDFLFDWYDPDQTEMPDIPNPIPEPPELPEPIVPPPPIRRSTRESKKPDFFQAGSRK